MFIAEKLKWIANTHPNKVITSFNGKETSYRDFYRKAENLAWHFQDLGYRKGDRIALLLMNSDCFSFVIMRVKSVELLFCRSIRS